MAKLILGEASAKKCHRLPFSNSMSPNIRKQVVEKIKASPLLLLQLDESVAWYIGRSHGYLSGRGLGKTYFYITLLFHDTPA